MKKIFTLTALSIIVSSLAAQNGRYKPSLSFGVQVVQPLGQFANQYDGYPAGLAGTFVGHLGNSPFAVGVDAAWNSMGSQSEDVPVYIGQDSDGDDMFEQGTMKIKSNHNRFHAIGRFSPFHGSFQIYVDAIAGFGTFATKTKIELEDGTYTDATGTNRYHWDVALNAGWAAGLKIELADNVFLEGRFESIRGSKTTFVNPETISVVNDSEIEFETLESATDVYSYLLGISFEF